MTTTMNRILSLVFCLAPTVFCAATHCAQEQAGAPLPAELYPRVHCRNGPSATRFLYEVDGFEGSLGAKVTFKGSPKEYGFSSRGVTVLWWGSIHGDSSFLESQSVGTSYQPTAVTRGDSSTDTIFVAGWLEDTGEAIIERWRFVLPEERKSGDPHAGLHVLRTTVLRCDGVQPLTALVRNPVADELYALEWPLSFPKRLLVLDLGLGSLPCSGFPTLYDGSNPADVAMYPEMEILRSAYAGRHPVAGWILFFEERPYWRSPLDYQEPYVLLVGFDRSLDGSLETLIPMTYRELFTTYPFAEWNDES